MKSEFVNIDFTVKIDYDKVRDAVGQGYNKFFIVVKWWDYTCPRDPDALVNMINTVGSMVPADAFISVNGNIAFENWPMIEKLADRRPAQLRVIYFDIFTPYNADHMVVYSAFPIKKHLMSVGYDDSRCRLLWGVNFDK